MCYYMSFYMYCVVYWDLFLHLLMACFLSLFPDSTLLVFLYFSPFINLFLITNFFYLVYRHKASPYHHKTDPWSCLLLKLLCLVLPSAAHPLAGANWILCLCLFSIPVGSYALCVLTSAFVPPLKLVLCSLMNYLLIHSQSLLFNTPLLSSKLCTLLCAWYHPKGLCQSREQGRPSSLPLGYFHFGITSE